HFGNYRFCRASRHLINQELDYLGYVFLGVQVIICYKITLEIKLKSKNVRECCRVSTPDAF
ncbi:MAG: hypothetical protein ACKPKB_20855, partial [Dolichospermum sp.]